MILTGSIAGGSPCIRVTLIEPSAVERAFFDSTRATTWKPTTSRAVMFALTQPPHVDVNEALVRPIHQPI